MSMNVSELQEVNSNDVERRMCQCYVQLQLTEWYDFSSFQYHAHFWSPPPTSVTSPSTLHFTSSTATQSNILKTKMQQGAGKLKSTQTAGFLTQQIRSTAKALPLADLLYFSVQKMNVQPDSYMHINLVCCDTLFIGMYFLLCSVMWTILLLWL